jgi:molybdopterin biosynthesis enzyme
MQPVVVIFTEVFGRPVGLTVLSEKPWIGLVGCPETSVYNHHSALRNTLQNSRYPDVMHLKVFNKTRDKLSYLS